jgi:DNA modification methylase
MARNTQHQAPPAHPFVLVDRPLSELGADPDNARRHPPAQLRALARAIETFGVVAPILVDAKLSILAGHARIEACRLLGRDTVPTIMIEHLDPARARAFMLADNRISELGEWDDRQLAVNLKALAEIDLGFSLESTGFSMGEIDLKIEGLDAEDAGADDPDEAPIDSGPSVARLGDTWRLGDHNIVCGSALDPAAYEALLAGEVVDAVFTDPPYNVPINGHVSGKGKRRHREFVAASGELSGPEYAAFLAEACRLAAINSRAGAVAFWFTDWRGVRTLLAVGAGAYDELLNICVWVKNNGGMGSLYRSAHELVAVFRNGATQHRNNVQLGRFGRNRSNVWTYPGANSFMKASEEADLLALHPTPKPVALVADALLDVTARRDLVLDPFLGSGTTLIACERLGRRCRAIELDPLYVDLAIRRWQRMTGEAAVRGIDGATFDDLAAAAATAASR